MLHQILQQRRLFPHRTDILLHPEVFYVLVVTVNGTSLPVLCYCRLLQKAPEICAFTHTHADVSAEITPLLNAGQYWRLFSVLFCFVPGTQKHQEDLVDT